MQLVELGRQCITTISPLIPSGALAKVGEDTLSCPTPAPPPNQPIRLSSTSFKRHGLGARTNVGHLCDSSAFFAYFAVKKLDQYYASRCRWQVRHWVAFCPTAAVQNEQRGRALDGTRTAAFGASRG